MKLITFETGFHFKEHWSYYLAVTDLLSVSLWVFCIKMLCMRLVTDFSCQKTIQLIEFIHFIRVSATKLDVFVKMSSASADTDIGLL